MTGCKRHIETDYDTPEKELRMPSSSFLDSQSFVARLAEELQKYNKKSETRRSKCFFVGIVAASVTLIVLTAAAVAVTLEYGRYQQVGPGDVLINRRDGKPLRVQQHYVSIPLNDIQNIPLDQIEKIATITLQWGPDEYGGARQYYYTVESVFRDMDEAVTEVRLSSNHHLIAANGKATLEDDAGNIMGIVDFEKLKEFEGTPAQESLTNSKPSAGTDLLRDPFEEAEDDKALDVGAETLLEFDDTEPDNTEGNDTEEAGLEPDETEAEKRGLGKKKKEKKQKIAPGPGGEDGYCMYGCGRMAVTYPYYYRPFFGYGYPLVGTEGMFQPGYGGNPVTEMAANGLFAGAGGVSGNNLGGSAVAGGPVAAPPGFS